MNKVFWGGSLIFYLQGQTADPSPVKMVQSRGKHDAFGLDPSESRLKLELEPFFKWSVLVKSVSVQVQMFARYWYRVLVFVILCESCCADVCELNLVWPSL